MFLVVTCSPAPAVWSGCSSILARPPNPGGLAVAVDPIGTAAGGSCTCYSARAADWPGFSRLDLHLELGDISNRHIKRKAAKHLGALEKYIDYIHMCALYTVNLAPVNWLLYQLWSAGSPTALLRQPTGRCRNKGRRILVDHYISFVTFRISECSS